MRYGQVDCKPISGFGIVTSELCFSDLSSPLCEDMFYNVYC